MKWDQKGHAKDWLLFPDNIGPLLSIDETSLANGELYTILTNKAAKGKQGALVAIVAGTQAETVISVIKRIAEQKRKQVKEITLDMAASMELIAKRCFPNADLVTDRFHVQRLALDAVQHMRIQHRWEAIDAENDGYELARKNQTKYEPEILPNGDTMKQLLARGRYVLYKQPQDWTERQKKRAELLFKHFPDLKEGYDLSCSIRNIFENTTERIYGVTRLARWHEKVRQSGFKAFNTVSRSIENHYATIANYFLSRSTNASAESFNAKVKAFRSQFRGVKSIEFFLYRLTKLYA
ncbi:MAG TPA: transposase [Arachidicoccus sp.]|nr:transposase [Arachidicoccus sp.]